MCLLLKATDAKPKHSFSRLQRLLKTSIAECLQLHEPKHPFFSYINAYKALSFFLSVHSRQLHLVKDFAATAIALLLATKSLDGGDGDASSSPQTQPKQR